MKDVEPKEAVLGVSEFVFTVTPPSVLQLISTEFNVFKPVFSIVPPIVIVELVT